MFNFSCKRRHEGTLSNLTTNSWPSTQNIDNWKSWIWKKNALLNLMNRQPDIYKIYLYVKDPYDAKYQLLINKREVAGIKHFNDSEAFINNQMIWIIFIKILKNTIQLKSKKNWSYWMIWLLICLVIKLPNLLVTELFIGGRKLNISIALSYNITFLDEIQHTISLWRF